MNIKPISRCGTFASTRILIAVGIVGLLLSFPLATGGETTNLVETSLLQPLARSTPDPVSTPGRLQLRLEIKTPGTNTDVSRNHVGITSALPTTADSSRTARSAPTDVSTKDLIEFAMIGAASNLALLPIIEGTAPFFDPSGSVLEESDRQMFQRPRPWVEVSFGDSLVQFFAPYYCPAPPGRRQFSDADESDRPWPVIAAGAATGSNWNDPGVYHAQDFLSISW